MPDPDPDPDPRPRPPRPRPPRPPAEIELIARAVILHGGFLLLCRNVRAGHAFLPGGHVEFNEPAADALRRELREEAALDARIGPCLLVGESSFTQKDRLRHEINLVFHGELLPPSSSAPIGTPPPVRSLEPHIAFEWFPVEQLHRAGFKPAWLIPHLQSIAAALLSAAARDTRTPPHPVWVSFMESSAGT